MAFGLKPAELDARVLSQRLKRRIAREVFSRVLVDRNPDTSDLIFLAGTGRSGTTWVMDLINYRNEYRVLFEPFRSDKVQVCGGFQHVQYIRPHDRNPAFLQAAHAILSGRIRNRWVDSHNRRLAARLRLIKDIRANLLLKWLHQNFPAMRLVLLLRHPCAVATSRLRNRWPTDLERSYLSQSALVEDFLYPFLPAITKVRDEFERQVLVWCIENYVPLKQFAPSELHIAFYEHFCVSPELEVGRLFGYLGKALEDGVLGNLRVPISVTHDSAITSGKSLTDSWHDQVTESQIARCEEILSLFGLHKIYSGRSMPNLSVAHRLMGGRLDTGLQSDLPTTGSET